MKLYLSAYSNLNICVAVSGGKDSMALLHYIYTHGREFGITLTALNCDHGIRGENSARDSAFVAEWCSSHDIPLMRFVRKGVVDGSENSARKWRVDCYKTALQELCADAVATAHHMVDNAETVLFRLARGSGLAGLAGICDVDIQGLKIVRPLLECTRADIDNYISENGVPFVEDETNTQDVYTRNKIRHNVVPALESAVGGAVKNIYKFSRLAYEDEDFFNRLIVQKKLVNPTYCGVEINFCDEKVLFRRAVIKALELLDGNIKDYTSEHLERIFLLQYAQTGKKFCFLGFIAYRDDGKIVVCKDCADDTPEAGFTDYLSGKCDMFGGQLLKITERAPENEGLGCKVLWCDVSAIPKNAVVRFMRDGDRFRKFGGGSKKLGDYFTDKKIRERVRGKIPLIAVDSDILAVCGVEISESIKVTENTAQVIYISAKNYGEI